MTKPRSALHTAVILESQTAEANVLLKMVHSRRVRLMRRRVVKHSCLDAGRWMESSFSQSTGCYLSGRKRFPRTVAVFFNNGTWSSLPLTAQPWFRCWFPNIACSPVLSTPSKWFPTVITHRTTSSHFFVQSSNCSLNGMMVIYALPNTSQSASLICLLPTDQSSAKLRSADG